MKNRNTKDVGGNHIYTFIFSNIALFAGVFFSLNSAPQVSAILYSLSLNLFLTWLVYYTSDKKKLKHHSQYFNDLTIGMGMLSAFISSVIFSFLMLFLSDDLSFGTLILFFAFLSLLIQVVIMKAYSWEKTFEKKLIGFRMTIQDEKEANGQVLYDFLKGKDMDEASDYLDKIGLFDSEVDAIIGKLRTEM